MYNVRTMIQDLVDEVMEHCQDAPAPLNKILEQLIYADELYEVCQDHVIDQLTSMSEDRSEEAKYEQFTET